VTRCVLLVNPRSGRGRNLHEARAVEDRLRDGGLDVTTRCPGSVHQARDEATAAVLAGIDVLTVMGGDGTVHLALQAVLGTATRLGVIPTGTGNDVARSLGVARASAVAAADVIVAGHTRRMDLGRIVTRTASTYFATVLATGFDSLVNERANAMSWPRGQSRYTLATLAQLRVFEPLSYSLELDGRTEHLEAMLVAVGNGPSYGGGLRMCEGAVLDDDRLDVVIIGPMSKPELLRVYPRLFRGTHVTHPAYRRERVSTVTVASAGIVAYADGERVGPLPLSVETIPAAVEVCVPARLAS